MRVISWIDWFTFKNKQSCNANRFFFLLLYLSIYNITYSNASVMLFTNREVAASVFVQSWCCCRQNQLYTLHTRCGFTWNAQSTSVRDVNVATSQTRVRQCNTKHKAKCRIWNAPRLMPFICVTVKLECSQYWLRLIRLESRLTPFYA